MNAFQKQLLLNDGRTLQEHAARGVTLCADIPQFVEATKREAHLAGAPLPRTPVSVEEFERDMRR